MAKKTKKVSKAPSFFQKMSQKINNFRVKLAEIKEEKAQALASATIPGKSKKDNIVVELSGASVAKSTAIVLLIIILFYFIKDISWILLMVFIAFLLAAAMDPIVDKMKAVRVPRSLSVLVIYFILIFLVSIFATKIVTLVAMQVAEIAQNIGQYITNLTSGGNTPFAKELQPYLDQFYKTLDLQAATSQIKDALQLIASQLLSISIGLMNLLLVLLLAFFMTVEEQSIEAFYSSLIPAKYTQYVSTRISAVKDQVGYWLRGQMLVCIIAGVITYIGLVILGVNYALTLSVIAGISLIIPGIGRVFAWAIAFPIVFNQSPLLSLWFSIFYAVLQQIENNVIGPYIMNRAVGLSPLIVMIAMMVGGQYLGILGLILAIPVATTVAIFVKDYVARGR